MSSATLALTAALAPACPTPQETALLVASLHSGPAAREGWERCRPHTSELMDLLRGEPADVRRLAPLLLEALQREQVPVEKRLLTVLRTAHHREELRSRVYRQICSSVLGDLAAAGIPLIVFRGAALGETIYGSPVQRHSHDINLLIPAADSDRATDALTARGLVAGRQGAPRDAAVLEHPTGLPILIHTSLFRVSYYRLEWGELWNRSGEGSVAGRTVRLLAPEHALLHTCCQAIQRPGRLPLVWACDAFLILRRYPDLDWPVFLDAAQRSRTRLPAYVALKYLADALQSPIPAFVLEGLGASVTQPDPVERDVAILEVRRRERRRLGVVLKSTADWRAKLTQLGWLLVPSAGYVRWAYGVRRTALLPLYYAGRLARYIAYRLRPPPAPIAARRQPRRR